MFGRVLKSLVTFRRDRRGNVAMLWGLMGAGLIGLIGLTVDFTRAQTIRTQLQNAADGAALAAARAPANVSLADRTELARAFFDAEAGEYAQGVTFSLSPAADLAYRVNVSTTMEGSLTQLISDQDWEIGVESEAVRGGVNLEVALVLDSTGSMAGSKLTALKSAATSLVDTIVQDVQTPYYSKLALVSYSVGVNAGSYAAQARGDIPAGRSISAASWSVGPQRTVTGATRANPVVVTANGHGFTNGQVVYLSGIRGMTQINNRYFRVASATTNTFALQDASTGANINGSSYSNWQSGGTQRAQRCQRNACEVVVTANSHGFSNGANVFITGVGGMNINNATGSGTGTTWTLSNVDSNTFTLVSSLGPSYSAYSNGGTAYCTTYGCEYYRFTNASGTTNVFRVSTCVSERTGAQAYTDASPATAFVGLNYPSTATNGACPTNTVLPLTTNRSTINARINGLSASGFTGGQIGAAWGWYMVSPNFSSLWTGSSAPAAYGAPETLKVVVLMTDGAFNVNYCNGVIAQNAGGGNNVDQINCNATNGDPLQQALSLCTAMKQRGIVVYTVGFDMASESQASRNMMRDCATSTSHAYMADNAADLMVAFQQIAQSISQLRISH
ncbi:MAG: ubiquitin-activating E1 FCCH domain-containing protein [Hyphomonadaceae bacterium]|nr:ubiquitin-activating E1 FCCH domain-containing protein [Hyphomonadaceae bacterium]